MKALRNKNGFTILEVLIAIFILATGVLVAYVVVQQMLSYTFSSSARLTAAYLAEEGIEVVRNIRDTAWVDGNSGNDWIGNGLASGVYQVSNSSYSLSSCPGSCSFEEMSFVFYLSGNNNKFKRKITIETPAADSIKVTSEVSWKENLSVKKVTAQSYLYNWK